MARYIDADALYSRAYDDVHYRASIEDWEFDSLVDYLNSEPTADVAPVRHGRWVEWWPPKHMILTGEEMLYRCSLCDAKYSDKENMRFCPNCGAKMDLEDEQ